jgi:CheY-like chemotaxis protein
MEALGTLAGGIAHDFNNLLTPIIGYTEIITRTLAPSDPNKDNLLQILRAGKRAKDLTRQILLFGRKKKASLQPLELHVVIKEALKLLRSTIPRTIEIDQRIDEHCGNVLADPGQIHQVLMNLCTNAAHAMEKEGGCLTVRLASVQLTATQSSQFGDIPPGSYLKLSLSDTGCGIDDAVMKRIFEPYFTTKEIGKGTGMGLAVTQAIVKNHNGHIAVRSTPRQGTEVIVFFPCLNASDECGNEHETALDLLGGNEHILFVDDEPMIVQLNLTLLGQLGYKVTAVTSSREALELFTAHPAEYDLIITDQTMPGLTGETLAKRILKLRPDTPIILCTGFSAAISEREAAQSGIRFCLTKPLSTEEMAKAIRRALSHDISCSMPI